MGGDFVGRNVSRNVRSNPSLIAIHTVDWVLAGATFFHVAPRLRTAQCFAGFPRPHEPDTDEFTIRSCKVQCGSFGAIMGTLSWPTHEWVPKRKRPARRPRADHDHCDDRHGFPCHGHRRLSLALIF